MSRRAAGVRRGMAVAVVVVLLSCATPALVVDPNPNLVTGDHKSCSSSTMDKIVPEPARCHPSTEDTDCMLGSSAAATLSGGGVHRESDFLPPPLLAALRRDVAELLQDGSFRQVESYVDVWPASEASPADWPRRTGVWGSLRHALALEEASESRQAEARATLCSTTA